MLYELFLAFSNLCFILRISPSGSFPKPLKAADERRALEKAAAGDMGARNLLIEHNLRLVAHVVKKYYASHEEQDDLISVGTIGLIKAIGSFDILKGAKLATYAARCIENEILMYFRASRKQTCEISLSEPIDTDKDGGELSLLDVVSYDEDILEQIDLSDKQKLLRAFVGSALDERERDIVTMRYGLSGSAPKAQREVAEIYSISRSYVSRIEKKALSKLAKCFERE